MNFVNLFMKYSLAFLLICLNVFQLVGQSALDQYNSRYISAVKAHLGEPTEENLNMKALAAFQLYYYHRDGYRKDESKRYLADAKASWKSLENTEDEDLKIYATIGLGNIFYLEGYDVKRSMEKIPISDGASYAEATKELNELLNKSYQYLVISDRNLPKLAKSALESLESDGASNSTINEVTNNYQDDYMSVLDTMSKLFKMSMELGLYTEYRIRFEQVEQGELFLKPYPNLPDQLFFN